MTREFHFRFDELKIDYQMIHDVLGYSDGNLPEPFNEYLQTAIAESRKMDGVRGSLHIADNVRIEEKARSVFAGDLEFKVGKTVCGELRGSERFAFFICTAGKDISEKSVSLLKGENPVLGYVYDVLGSAMAEAAGDMVELFLKKEVAGNDVKITNRYSPGYCNWSVADQHKLFSLFGGATSGVTLTGSALMHPVKSISGIIGIGRDVHYRDYQCTLCTSKNCVYRKVLSK